MVMVEVMITLNLEIRGLKTKTQNKAQENQLMESVEHHQTQGQELEIMEHHQEEVQEQIIYSRIQEPINNKK